MTRGAPWARATWQAAEAVEPVAMPSSTTMAVPPAERQAGAFAPEEPGPPLELVAFALLHHRQVVGADPRPA